MFLPKHYVTTSDFNEGYIEKCLCIWSDSHTHYQYCSGGDCDPYLLLKDVAVALLIALLSLAAAVTIVCRQRAVGPAAFIFPAVCIHDVEFVRSQFS